jgi:hypothetical protein
LINFGGIDAWKEQMKDQVEVSRRKRRVRVRVSIK